MVSREASWPMNHPAFDGRLEIFMRNFCRPLKPTALDVRGERWQLADKLLHLRRRQ